MPKRLKVASWSCRYFSAKAAGSMPALPALTSMGVPWASAAQIQVTSSPVERRKRT